MQQTTRVYSEQEVGRHNKVNDLWIIVDDLVYDLTDFVKMHPGGSGVIERLAGQDCTDAFYELHRKDVLDRYSNYVIGKVSGKKSRRQEPLISDFPYAEHCSNHGFKSPYYTEHHLKFQRDVRKWLVEEVIPIMEPSEASGRSVKKMYKILGKQNMFAIRAGVGPHLNGTKVLGYPGEKMDTFHERIVMTEFGRMGMPGAMDGATAGNFIGVQPIMKFAQPHIQRRVLPEIWSGQKCVVLAISEPWVGSDVARLRTTAEKSPCGKFYIVNGVKKWITSAQYADYFTTAVRTGGDGMGGVSMLLIEKSPGVSFKKIKTTYSMSAGTSLIFFDNVKVPVENLLGQENRGFKVIVKNFNHERWGIVCISLGSTRRVVEECFRWANQRQAFGKNLLAQPVIRNKLGNMVSEMEAVSAWLDTITHQMGWMNKKQQAKYLAGPIALLKLRATTVHEKACAEAIQIFGGRAVSKTGMGAIIERARGVSKLYSVYGGSEEIMADLGIRQAMKTIDPDAKL